MNLKTLLQEHEINTDGYSEEELLSAIKSYISKKKRPSASLQRQAEEIYHHYPYKVGHMAAIKSIATVLRLYPYDKILSATQLFARSWEGKDKKYCPNPSTWYNQHRFLDDPETWGGRGSVTDTVKDQIHQLTLRIDNHECNKDSPNYWAHHGRQEPPDQKWEELKDLRQQRHELRSKV